MMILPQVFANSLVVLFVMIGLLTATPVQQTVPPPVLISPAEGAVMDNGCRDQSDSIDWDFDWEDVWGATLYHIKVWHNPEKPVVDDANLTISEYKDVSRKSYIIEANRKGWCWTVRARVQRKWGEWSEVRCFEVEPVDTDCP